MVSVIVYRVVSVAGIPDIHIIAVVARKFIIALAASYNIVPGTAIDYVITVIAVDYVARRGAVYGIFPACAVKNRLHRVYLVFCPDCSFTEFDSGELIIRACVPVFNRQPLAGLGDYKDDIVPGACYLNL